MDGHQKQREESRRMIEEALFALMEKKSYTQIRVSEIAEKADVSRRTFYRLYQEKDEVLRSYFGKLCEEYCENVPELEFYDIAQIAREYFSFWYRHREFLLLMHKNGMDGMLYYEISQVSADVIKGRIAGREDKDMEGVEYFADYSAGGFILLLQRWIAGGMNEPPLQYAEIVSESLLKFTKSIV